MNKWIFRAIISCILIIIMGTSCKLKFKEVKYSIPTYRTIMSDKGKKIIHAATRYSVQNYWFHKKQFEKAALDIICQEINDSIPETLLDIAFLADKGRGNYAFNTPIRTYTWTMELPDSLKVTKRKGANYTSEMIPFDCALNEKYKIRNDVK